jgi:hypothetical protein
MALRKYRAYAGPHSLMTFMRLHKLTLGRDAAPMLQECLVIDADSQPCAASIRRAVLAGIGVITSPGKRPSVLAYFATLHFEGRTSSPRVTAREQLDVRGHRVCEVSMARISDQLLPLDGQPLDE